MHGVVAAMRMGWMGIGALLCAGPALAAPVVMEDNLGVNASLLRGDVARLQAMTKVEGIIGELASAGYHRVRGDLVQSTRSARACMDALPGTPPNQAPIAGFLCESMLAGNALASGDIAGWATTMDGVRLRYQRDMAPAMPAGDEVVDVTRPRVERFRDWPRSTLPVTTPAADVVVSLQGVNELPSIELELRAGDVTRRERFIIDTGAPRSHLSRKLAAELGLEVVEDFMVAGIDDGEPTLAGLVRPVDLVIGGLRVQDVSFNSEAGRAFNLIGMDVLRALGPLLISKDALTVYGKGRTPPCTQRMAVTSSMLASTFQPRYMIRNGENARLMLVDTGFSGAFQVRGADVGEVPPEAVRRRNIITTRWSQDITYVPAEIEVTFNDAAETIQADVALQDADLLPFALRMGFGAVPTYALYLDVANGMGCTVKQPEPMLPAPPPRRAR